MAAGGFETAAGLAAQTAGHSYLVSNGYYDEAARAMVAGEISSRFPFPANLAVAIGTERALQAAQGDATLDRCGGSR